MSDSVAVSVPARLHLGFLDLDGALGRRFGSIGLGLDEPLTRIEIGRAERDTVTGAEQERSARHLDNLRQWLKLGGHHRLNVAQAIPSHAGLGSGTQLALAIAAGLRVLHRLALDVRGDASRLGRGARSGVGVALFEHGGVVVDGGRSDDGGPPPLIARLPFPPQWRILLLLDHKQQGVHGAAEIDAFERLPAFPKSIAAHICHLTLLKTLPALAEHDIDSFGAAITETQAAIGDHFAPAQGGRFTSSSVAASLSLLQDWKIAGVGQSSWGPTGFAFMRDEAEAKAIVERLGMQPAAHGLELMVVRASKGGAHIERASLSHVRAS